MNGISCRHAGGTGSSYSLTNQSTSAVVAERRRRERREEPGAAFGRRIWLEPRRLSASDQEREHFWTDTSRLVGSAGAEGNNSTHSRANP